MPLIKPSRFVEGTQDLYDRRVYVIRPKQELLDHIVELCPEAASELEIYNGSTVVMTEEVPFEGSLEGWRPTIKMKCKEAFIRENFNYFPIADMDKPNDLLVDMDTLVAFFDQWWIAEESDYIELIEGSWKTRECCRDELD
ncbi:MAG: hypothetical protein AAFX93_15010 [Verrucomicrobiota bacterium]